MAGVGAPGLGRGHKVHLTEHCFWQLLCWRTGGASHSSCKSMLKAISLLSAGCPLNPFNQQNRHSLSLLHVGPWGLPSSCSRTCLGQRPRQWVEKAL